MSQFQTHDLAAIIVVVGTIPITGWSTDGGCEVAFNTDMGEGSVGAGGAATFSKSADRSATATLTLKADSPDCALLNALIEEQLLPGALPRLPFLMRNTLTGESVEAETCAFQTRPSPTANKTVADAVYVLWLPAAKHTITPRTP